VDGWTVGFLAGGVVVTIVVALLLLLIRGARRTAEKAEAIAASLSVAHTRSNALRELDDIPAATARIRHAAAAARGSLVSGGAR
jgi:hypothetical protein